MTTRKYTSRSQQTTLSSAVTSGATVFPVVAATTLLGGATISAGQTMTIVIDPDTALEEVVDIYSASGNPVSGNNLTVVRGIDGSSAQDHSAGAIVRHMIIGRDLRESNTHIESSNGVHGLASTSSVVGTQDTQTLYNKTLVAPVLTATTENDAGISFQGTTVDSYATTLSVVDPTANRTITLPNTSGTVDLTDSATTLTNKTITSPTINGTPVITGLSSAGMVNSSATPKIYVDSILGSATAASTSAASAATSASSAATSASSAATSASSAATSQTAAATSATSAAASATSAATYLTSVQTSATSAATSATSAAASATTAAASVATISTYASNALTSANSAATSAASAAAYTSAAATSAASAATSASSAAASASSITGSVSAAATSATSAAASATAAATSASSAATSASSAATSQTAAATSATSSAASATAASTSATSAATQATAAATSATSAAASATAAATSATSAAASATAAATSATSSAASFTSADQKYLGAKSSAPSLNNQGGALATGAQYWNTSNNTMYVWNGSAWAAATATANITMYRYTASGGETSKSGADDNSATLAYAVGFEQVYLNGVLLVRGVDYTASTGSSITGLAALVANDILVVLAFTPFSVSNAVPLSTYTAKGDVAIGTGSSTVGTLNVGADGSTLVANSSASTGVSWTGNQAAGKNAVINGNLDIWQRGTSFTGVVGDYTADRWQGNFVGTNVNTTVTQNTSVPNVNSKYSIKCQQVTTSATLTEYSSRQFIEQSNILPLLGKTSMLSFWYRSNKTGSHGVRIYGSYNTGGTDQVTTITVNAADTWEYKTVTVTAFSAVSAASAAPTTAGALIDIGFRVGGTGAGFTSISANDYYQFTQVQLEVGSAATTFTRAGGTLQGELAACQRYYWRQNATGVYSRFSNAGTADSTTFVSVYINNPVPMRVVPTSLDYSNLTIYAGGFATLTAVSLQSDSTQTMTQIGCTGTGITQYRAYNLLANNTTSSYVGLSAEL